MQRISLGASLPDRPNDAPAMTKLTLPWSGSTVGVVGRAGFFGRVYLGQRNPSQNTSTLPSRQPQGYLKTPVTRNNSFGPDHLALFSPDRVTKGV